MRIFWYGNHKILINTELKRLRHLGFEVFCPNNMSINSLHQSAANGWSEGQFTTLSSDVFGELSRFDFFNLPITHRISSLLNEFFDVVIVTLHPQWLLEIVRTFQGKIIFRTCGHVKIMSDIFESKMAMRAILEKDDFWYVPHAMEAAQQENSWLSARMKIAPYCVGSEILSYKNTWVGDRNEVMVSCPNIQNDFFQMHYQFLKRYFNEKCFRFYGVQHSRIDDHQVVGTIRYESLVASYRSSKAFLYTYVEPAILFLPPIEMMIVGGPVVYLRGSLLDRYYGSSESPGRALSPAHAIELCKSLLAGDQQLLHSILESQKSIYSRYLPENVWPLFDEIFLELLSGRVQSKPILKIKDIKDAPAASGEKKIVIFNETFPLQQGFAGESKSLPVLVAPAANIGQCFRSFKMNEFDFIVSNDFDLPKAVPSEHWVPESRWGWTRLLIENPKLFIVKLVEKIQRKFEVKPEQIHFKRG